MLSDWNVESEKEDLRADGPFCALPLYSPGLGNVVECSDWRDWDMPLGQPKSRALSRREATARWSGVCWDEREESGLSGRGGC